MRTFSLLLPAGEAAISSSNISGNVGANCFSRCDKNL